MIPQREVIYLAVHFISELSSSEIKKSALIVIWKKLCMK